MLFVKNIVKTLLKPPTIQHVSILADQKAALNYSITFLRD